MTTAKRHVCNLLLCGLVAGAVVGCSFANRAHQQIAAAATLADGTMKTYAKAWKEATNTATPARLLYLQNQRTQVMAYSFKVGASLNTAERVLEDYESKLPTGTNSAPTPKEVVQALLQAAIQDAGSLAGEISILTSDPSWANGIK